MITRLMAVTVTGYY